MLNMKKVMVAGATLALAAGVAVPFGAANVASAAEGDYNFVTGVFGDCIYLGENAGNYTVETVIGKKKVTDVYENVTSIDISYIAGKEAKVTVTNNATEKKDEITVAAQPKKVKATFDPENYSASLEVDGKAVDSDDIFARVGNNCGVDIDDLEQFTVKGATLYLSKFETESKKAIESYVPASKEAKVKIPAKKNGPKVTVDPKKFNFKLAKGCEYEATVDEKVITAAAASTTTVSMKDINKALGVASVAKDETTKYSEVSKAITFKFYKSATNKAMQSKATVLVVPAQNELSGDELATWEVAYNKNKTAVTGITVKNTSTATNPAIEFMVVAKDTKLSDIDLADKTTKWTTIKKKDQTKKIAVKKLKEGDMLIVRAAGQKANAKKDIAFSLASQMTTCGAVLAVPDAVKNDLAVTLSKPATAGTTASNAAINVSDTTYGADNYCYEVGSKVVKVYEIGKAAPSGATKIADVSNATDVAAKKGDWITVYAEKDGAVVAFKSIKVTADVLN